MLAESSDILLRVLPRLVNTSSQTHLKEFRDLGSLSAAPAFPATCGERREKSISVLANIVPRGKASYP